MALLAMHGCLSYPCFGLVVRSLHQRAGIPRLTCVQCRGIRAQARQSHRAQRERQLQRPLEYFSAPGEGEHLRQGESDFVLSPTIVSVRSDNLSKERKRMQKSKDSRRLLRALHSALENESIDVSVFGAAMQRCGQGQWWDALLQVRGLQQQVGACLGPECLSIFLIALVRSIRGSGSDDALSRQHTALSLAKQAWIEANPSPSNCVVLCSALRLCSVVTEVAECLPWAEDLWQQATEDEPQPNSICFGVYALVLEENGLHDRVDELLFECAKGTWEVNRVALGALMNASVDQRNWQRSERLWQHIVGAYGVTPASIQYDARAKVLLASARPDAAARVFEDMLVAGVDPSTRTAQNHLQALIVVFHSSLASEDLRRLLGAFAAYESLWADESANEMHLLRLTIDAFLRLNSKPLGVKLRDVLITLKSQQSDMARWSDSCAGDMYVLA